MLPSRLEANPRAIARASYAIRSRTSEENLLEIDSTMVDPILAQHLPAPAQQLRNLLSWLRREAGDDHLSAINIGNCDQISSIVGTVDGVAFGRLLRWAGQEGLVQVVEDGKKATLTPKAWEDKPLKEAERAEMSKSEDATDTTKGHCPSCGPNRNAKIVGSHEEQQTHDEQVVIWSRDTYNILKCGGCDAVYVQHVLLFSEDEYYVDDPRTGEFETVIDPKITYWPAPELRQRPDWLDSIHDLPLQKLLGELYNALNADLRTLAAIGARTALDRAMVLAGASEASTFREKLEELKTSGLIGQRDVQVLEVLTDAGSAAAHRAWNPEPDRLATIMNGTESFLYRAIVFPTEVAAMKPDVPRKPKRRKKERSTKGR